MSNILHTRVSYCHHLYLCISFPVKCSYQFLHIKTVKEEIQKDPLYYRVKHFYVSVSTKLGIFANQFLWIVQNIWIRFPESSKNFVTDNKKLPKIVMKVCMMYSMILRSHNWFRISPYSIMNVGSPYAGEKKHEDMSEIVNWHKEEEKNVRRGLQNSI